MTLQSFKIEFAIFFIRKFEKPEMFIKILNSCKYLCYFNNVIY